MKRHVNLSPPPYLDILSAECRRIYAWEVLVLCLLTACAPKHVKTPEGRTAWTAQEILIRVGELQSAAIRAHDTGGLPTDTTRRVVTFCVGAERTLRDTPQGWQAALRTAWSALRGSLARDDVERLAVPLAAVDAVLAGMGGGA